MRTANNIIAFFIELPPPGITASGWFPALRKTTGLTLNGTSEIRNAARAAHTGHPCRGRPPGDPELLFGEERWISASLLGRLHSEWRFGESCHGREGMPSCQASRSHANPSAR